MQPFGFPAFNFLAEVAVDERVRSSLARSFVGQYKVDAQALIALETTGSVVPPRKRVGVWMLRSVQVGPALVIQCLHARALRVGVKYVAQHAVCVPRVECARANIEVAADNRRCLRGGSRGQVLDKRIEPAKLALIVGVFEILAVRAIHRRELDAGNVCSDEP